MQIRFPWFTLYGNPRGRARWRCAAAMLAHEFIFEPWGKLTGRSEHARPNRWTRRYAIGVPATYPPQGWRGSYFMVSHEVDLAELQVVDGAFLFVTDGAQYGAGSGGSVIAFYRGNAYSNQWEPVQISTFAGDSGTATVAFGDNPAWSVTTVDDPLDVAQQTGLQVGADSSYLSSSDVPSGATAFVTTWAVGSARMGYYDANTAFAIRVESDGIHLDGPVFDNGPALWLVVNEVGVQTSYDARNFTDPQFVRPYAAIGAPEATILRICPSGGDAYDTGFVWVATDPTGGGLFISGNGSDWTNYISNQALLGICWAGDTVGYIIGSVEDSDGAIWHGTDLAFLSHVTTPADAGDTTVFQTAWNGTQAVAVGTFNGATKSIMTSPDGDTWTIQDSDLDTDALYDVCWCDGLSLWVAGGVGGIVTSPNGVDWTFVSTGLDGNVVQSVLWDGSLIWIAGTGGSDNLQTSGNGTDWTTADPWGTGSFAGLATDGSSVAVSVANHPYLLIFNAGGASFLGLSRSLWDNPATIASRRRPNVIPPLLYV